MLNYIECEKFVEKKISFHKGLNVVVGDSKSTNSIGKSTLLKVVDFVFGGETFITHGPDAIEALGHHTYFFSLTFDSVEYKLSRSTDRPKYVVYYAQDSQPADVEISKYTEWLRGRCCPTIDNLSFRKIVSPVSRVWGKGTPEVTKPLHSHSSDSGTDCIDYLISIFERYGAISDLTIRLNNTIGERAALNKAFSRKIISKVNKTQYKENLTVISKANGQLDFIRDQLSTLAITINELIDGEVLSLKFEKDQLIKLRTLLSAEIERTKSNLESGKSVSAKSFEALLDLIPDINISRLEKIESFHKGLVRVLHKQIKAKSEELQEQLDSVNTEIEEYNTKIAQRISNMGNPTHIVDAVADLTLQISKSQTENDHYDQAIALKDTIKKLSESLEKIKVEILADIEAKINDWLGEMIGFIYKGQTTAPHLKLTPKNYVFSVPKDTGTGKAFASLILLDAALLIFTKIPFLIHDSFLFKNIEDNAIINMLYVYRGMNQQSFIALDGSVLDSVEAMKMIQEGKVIELNASKLLYTTNWRAQSDAKTERI
ncbi:DUF2326 domain-containing protein [Pseudomonas sp.]|uniref:DUF2326 domain-containing protein n=1 Tax=Pseudomonas sp. TaxID=306 RepID=UPI0039829C35